MNHHNLALSVPGPDSGRQSLIQYVAAAVRELVRHAESGATPGEMLDAATQVGTDCAGMAVATGHDNGPAEVVAILRRLLRKEARRRWEASGAQDREGDGNAALHDRKVSVLLDAGADALGSPLLVSKPVAATSQVLHQSLPVQFARSKASLAC